MRIERTDYLEPPAPTRYVIRALSMSMCPPVSVMATPSFGIDWPPIEWRAVPIAKERFWATAAAIS